MKFFVATTALMIAPGPTAMLVVHYALIYGKKISRYTIPSVMLGDIVAIILAFSSIEGLLTIFPNALYFFKIGGGAYLIFLGLVSLGSENHFNQEERKVH